MDTHIRRPDLPWRPAASTECGIEPTPGMALADRDGIRAQLAAKGIQHVAAAGMCMACISHTTRWPSFAADPVGALSREYHDRQHPRFADELRALAALAARHRDEFEALLRDRATVVDLDSRRR